jgi:hypothetical protein
MESRSSAGSDDWAGTDLSSRFSPPDREAEYATMSDSTRPSYSQRSMSQASAGGGNAVYALGLIGALVYFWQQADSFGQYLLAILKALVWPAFLVYEVFQGLLG